MVKVLFTVAALFFVSAHAWATPITLTVTNALPPNTNTEPPKSSGSPEIQTWLIGVIDAYNSAHSTSLPTDVIGAEPDVKVNLGEGVLSIVLPGNSYNYLVLHWGGKKCYQAFSLIGNTDMTDIFRAPGKNGLSFYSFYGSVAPPAANPEPCTMLLLGSGLAGLAVFRKRFKKT